MVEHEDLDARVRQAAERVWDTGAIEAWLKRIARDGIPAAALTPRETVDRKQLVLDSVQRRAEECTFLSHI